MANDRPFILVVDDDPDYAEFLRNLLVRNGFRAVSAGTARAALQALGEGQVDLVITDVVMPDMDGIEFLRSLQPAARGLPVIAVTGSALNARGTLTRVMCALGANRVLPKPLSTAELLAAVRAALDGRAERKTGLNQTT